MKVDAADLLNGIPFAVLLIDQTARIELANPIAVELFGQNPTGLNAASMLRQASVLTAIDAVLREAKQSQAEFLHNGPTGERMYRIHMQPMPDLGALLTLTDTSEQESSERIRRDFMANLSHELRTPLTSLTGFIETLRTSARDDPEARERFLEIMENEARRMGRMVEDLLSLSRVEVDERIRPRTPVNICGVVRSAVATLEGKLKDANIQVVMSGTNEQLKVPGDRDQLIQLYLNLIENAIKYGGTGKTIHIDVEYVPRDTALRMPAVRVDVRDEGVGIAPVHLPRLTERFYRIDDHRSRDQGGTGLGLSIVKHIVNRHRGRVKITSEQGVGSAFSTIIPSV
jgi:two-component system phosphate regulon sensor histidine kinase PhoR